MANIIVLVTFYSRAGDTEALAHAAAVGAVQARAGIRLRRVPDADANSILDRMPEAAECLRRMHQEYIAPRDADVLAADALILASPGDVDVSAPEWSSYLALLSRLQSEGKLAGKVAAAVPIGTASESFSAFLRRLGFASVSANESAAMELDSVGQAVALGRQVVAAAESTKENAGT